MVSTMGFGRKMGKFSLQHILKAFVTSKYKVELSKFRLFFLCIIFGYFFLAFNLHIIYVWLM